jgi:HlyD family secretion protein
MRLLLAVVTTLLAVSCVSLTRQTDALIVSRSAIEIDTVKSGDTPLHISSDGVIVNDLSPVVVVVISVEDGQGANLRGGQPAVMRARGQSARGQLAKVLDGSTFESTMAIVHFGLDAPESNPGGSAEITIDAGKIPNALYVVRPAGVRADSEGSAWRLQHDERRASRTPVRYGRVAGPLVEIVGGLKAGDRVILSDPSRWSGRSQIRISR